MGDWNAYILDSDVIIVNLDEICPDEFEFIIKILTYSQFKENKTFIIISTIMTWSKVASKNGSSDQDLYSD